MGIWQSAEVNPPHPCYREKLIKSSKNEDVDLISNTENPKAVDGWMMRKHSRVDGCWSLTALHKVFYSQRTVPMGLNSVLLLLLSDATLEYRDIFFMSKC